MIIENKYVIVKHETEDYHLAEFMASVKVETEQELLTYDTLESVDILKVPLLKVDEVKEPKKIYNIDGKVVCDYVFIKPIEPI